MNVESILTLLGPVLLAALGGLISEYAGLLNIGLEGFMILGAFCAIAGAHASPSWPAGISAGLFLALSAGFLLAAVLAWTAVRRKANIFIAGLAINLIAASLVSFGGSWIFHTRSVVNLSPAQIVPPGGMSWVSGWLSIVVVLAFWWFQRSTVSGLRLRVLGSDSAMLLARGIDTDRLKMIALLASGMLASLAGALLSLRLGAFVPNQSSGKGWIALVLVFVGARHPLGLILASLAFVILEQFSLSAQAGLEHPALLVGLPYLLVFGSLILAQALQKVTANRRQRR